MKKIISLPFIWKITKSPTLKNCRCVVVNVINGINIVKEVPEFIPYKPGVFLVPNTLKNGEISLAGSITLYVDLLIDNWKKGKMK